MKAWAGRSSAALGSCVDPARTLGAAGWMGGGASCLCSWRLQLGSDTMAAVSQWEMLVSQTATSLKAGTVSTWCSLACSLPVGSSVKMR